jgi:hypothetical protein
MELVSISKGIVDKVNHNFKVRNDAYNILDDAYRSKTGKRLTRGRTAEIFLYAIQDQICGEEMSEFQNKVLKSYDKIKAEVPEGYKKFYDKMQGIIK